MSGRRWLFSSFLGRTASLSLWRARLSGMPLIIILILLLLLFGGGGYYMGPGIGYYGGGGLSLILALVVIYLLFGRSRNRL
jgi:hypothetical protein